MIKYKMLDKSIYLTDDGSERCIGCKKCMKGCPMLERFCENPKELLDGLSEAGEFSSELVYSCMLCGYCEEVCPVDISFNDIFFSYREDLEKECKGKLPKELNLGGVDFHQNLSFSKLFSKKLKGGKSTVFFPGCALMGAKSEIVSAVNSYIDEKLGGCEIMTHCCGKPTNYMGKNDRFSGNIESIQSELDRNKVETLVAGCLNCYKTLEKSIEGVEVVSLWTLLDELKAVETLKIDHSDIGIVPTVHDPCPTRREDEIHSAIRSILGDMGMEYKEMKYNRRETLCCGAGAMVSISQKELAEGHMKRRCDESESDYILTYCQECTESFMKQGKKSIHILDMIFGNYESLEYKETGLADKWLKRFVLSNFRR